jgi:hypothetical protein
LSDELQKKKQLEDMQLALERLLLNEQQKREDLEEERRHQEAALQLEKQLLMDLENERCMRNKEYEVMHSALFISIHSFCFTTARISLAVHYIVSFTAQLSYCGRTQVSNNFAFTVKPFS